MFRRTTVHQHIYGVAAAACPRPRGGTDRESRLVFRTGDASKDFGLSIGVLDRSGIKGVAKREPQIVENSHHHYSTSHSRQSPDDVLSESQLLGRLSLDHEDRAISLFSADATERSEQSAGVDWFIRGAEWPKCFLIRMRFHCGKRDRVVDVFNRIVGVPDICTADTMQGAAVRIAIRGALMEKTPLIYISPSPRAFWSCFSVARQVFSLTSLTPRIGTTPVLLLRAQGWRSSCVTCPNPLQ